MSNPRAHVKSPNFLRAQIVLALSDHMSEMRKISATDGVILSQLLFTIIHNIDVNDSGNKRLMQSHLNNLIRFHQKSGWLGTVALIAKYINKHMEHNDYAPILLQQAPAPVAEKYIDANFVKSLLILCNHVAKHYSVSAVTNAHTYSIIIFALETLFTDVHVSIQSFILQELANKDYDYEWLTNQRPNNTPYPLQTMLNSLQNTLLMPVDAEDSWIHIYHKHIESCSGALKGRAYVYSGMVYYSQSKWMKAVAEFNKAGRLLSDDEKTLVLATAKSAIQHAWTEFGKSLDFVNAVLAPPDDNVVIPLPDNAKWVVLIVKGIVNLTDPILKRRCLSQSLRSDTLLGGIFASHAGKGYIPKLMNVLTIELRKGEISLTQQSSQSMPVNAATPVAPASPTNHYEIFDENIFNALLNSRVYDEKFTIITELLELLKRCAQENELTINYSDMPTDFTYNDKLIKNPIALQVNKPVDNIPPELRGLPVASVFIDRTIQISMDKRDVMELQAMSRTPLRYGPDVSLRMRESQYFFRKLYNHLQTARRAPATFSSLVNKYSPLFRKPTLTEQEQKHPNPSVPRNGMG